MPVIHVGIAAERSVVADIKISVDEGRRNGTTKGDKDVGIERETRRSQTELLALASLTCPAFIRKAVLWSEVLCDEVVGNDAAHAEAEDAGAWWRQAAVAVAENSLPLGIDGIGYKSEDIVTALSGKVDQNVGEYFVFDVEQHWKVSRERHGSEWPVDELVDLGVPLDRNNPHLLTELSSGHDLHKRLVERPHILPKVALALFELRSDSVHDKHHCVVRHVLLPWRLHPNDTLFKDI